MNNIFFFQTQPIPDSSSIFDQFNQQNIFFSYFQVDQNYYLFVYAQKSIDINFLYQSIDVIQELDSKQRKIRSFRGFFLYALEIMQMGENYEILKTNLQPFFWRKVKTIIRQNKKAALQEFLFGSDSGESYQGSSPRVKILEDQIKALQNQIDSLQEKIIQLEQNQRLNFKDALRGTLHAPDETKIIQQNDSTLKYSLENDNKINQQVEESISVSETSQSPFKTAERSEEYNIPSDQEKAQNRVNFITLGRISEQEKIEIIQRGFQLQAQGKISLKKY